MAPRLRLVLRILVQFFAALGVLTMAALIAMVACRRRLAEWAIRDALTGANVTDLRVSVTRLNPGILEISPLEFTARGQRMKIARITLIRDAPLERSLGRLEVEGIDAQLDLAALFQPAPATTPYGPAKPAEAGPKFDLAALPLEKISASGRLQMQFAHASAPVSLEFQARMAGNTTAAGSGVLNLPGLTAHIAGDYNLTTGRCVFEVADATADIQPLRDFVGGVAPLPFSDWTATGRLQATARGAYDNHILSGSARLTLREARLAYPPAKLDLSGIEADIQLTDLAKPATADRQRIAVSEIKVADLVAQNATAYIQVLGLASVWVREFSVSAFGGRVSTEPFHFDPARSKYDVTVLAEGLRV